MSKKASTQPSINLVNVYHIEYIYLNASRKFLINLTLGVTVKMFLTKLVSAILINIFLLSAIQLNAFAGPSNLAPRLYLNKDILEKFAGKLKTKNIDPLNGRFLPYNNAQSIKWATLLADGNCIPHSVALSFVLWLQGRQANICSIQTLQKKGERPFNNFHTEMDYYHHYFVVSQGLMMDAVPHLFFPLLKHGFSLILLQNMSKENIGLVVPMDQKFYQRIMRYVGDENYDTSIIVPALDLDHYVQNFLRDISAGGPSHLAAKKIGENMGITINEFIYLANQYAKNISYQVEKSGSSKINIFEFFKRYGYNLNYREILVTKNHKHINPIFIKNRGISMNEQSVNHLLNSI